MPDEVLKTLLECGVHFGHQTRRWNPKMKRFIFGERSGIYIIDLEKTKKNLEIACDYVKDLASKGGNVFFVGTKKQAKDVIQSEATRAEMPYINHRWMGGLLTNFETVKKSMDKLTKIEKMKEDGITENLTKKEVSRLNKLQERMNRDFGGIREMKSLPQAIFIIDSKREDIAIREARRLGLPIIALIDTNCDPDEIDLPIPGNDDALKSIRYIAACIADAVIAGKKELKNAEMVKNKISETSASAEDNAKSSTDDEGKPEPVATSEEPEK